MIKLEWYVWLWEDSEKDAIFLPNNLKNYDLYMVKNNK